MRPFGLPDTGSRLGGSPPLMTIADLERQAIRKDTGFRLLSPIDVQCINACGVTFAASALGSSES